MSIHAALGHQICILEKRNKELKDNAGQALYTVRVLLESLESVTRDDPAVRDRYATVIEMAKKTLGC